MIDPAVDMKFFHEWYDEIRAVQANVDRLRKLDARVDELPGPTQEWFLTLIRRLAKDASLIEKAILDERLYPSSSV